MSMWKKFVTAVTAGCLVATGVSFGVSGSAAAVPAAAPSAKHQPFKVLSYNVRYNANTDKARGIPAWTARRAQVFALVRSNNPDIFTIIEAEYSNGMTDGHKVKQNMPGDFIAEFGKDYAFYNGTNNAPKLIFYRKSRFRLSTAGDPRGSVQVPNVYTKGVKVGSADCWSLGEDRNLAYTKLQDIRSGRSYFVAAMHPLNHPNCYRGREANMKVLQSAIETKASGMSVLAMGDMNTDWDCRTAAKATCYGLDGDIISRIEEGGPGYNLFRSQRHSAPTTSNDTTVNTNWYGSAAGSNASIDYIFHSGGDMTTSNPQVDKGNYGGKDSPSDHYAISAIIQPSVFRAESTVDTSGAGADPGTRVYFTRVNADACADKIVWNPALNRWAFSIALSKCNGTFAPPFNDNIRSESRIGQFSFADVNGDSCADKIYRNRLVDSGRIRVFLSNCNGIFKPVISNANITSVSPANAHFYFGKVNADACEDLIYWNRFVDSGRTRVFMSNCNGTFRNVISDTGSGFSTSPTAAFYFADVTGDGLADKVAWDPAARSGHTRVYRSAGNGTFPFLSERASGGSVNPRTQFFFADVTGDKKADELAWRADLGQGAIQIFLGKGTRFSNGPTTDVSGNSEADDTVFSFADINGDGASDKVYWNPRMNGGATRVYLSVRRAD
jgi:endonuclease/exonuclease/phosphatase family metal-dependent hydrolase